MLDELSKLSSFRRFQERLENAWPHFLAKRSERLIQGERNGTASEKVAENILDDLFTLALDWELGDLNNQVNYADLVLTKLGLKRLLVEVKRPGSLSWNQNSIERALAQARGYAERQRVKSIAISDGTLFYAADLINGGLRTRAKIPLDIDRPVLDLWWLSVDGIYREPAILEELVTRRSRPDTVMPDTTEQGEGADILLHPKYKVPARCFAYVENALDHRTWKLPYRFIDGSVDEKHLSGAIRAVISNYRGVRVSIPEAAIPDVLVRLGKAAAEIKKLPGQTSKTPATYKNLSEILHQLDRLKEVL